MVGSSDSDENSLNNNLSWTRGLILGNLAKINFVNFLEDNDIDKPKFLA